jgi:outer membrane lipoprotein-sorting protein
MRNVTQAARQGAIGGARAALAVLALLGLSFAAFSTATAQTGYPSTPNAAGSYAQRGYQPAQPPQNGYGVAGNQSQQMQRQAPPRNDYQQQPPRNVGTRYQQRQPPAGNHYRQSPPQRTAGERHPQQRPQRPVRRRGQPLQPHTPAANRPPQSRGPAQPQQPYRVAERAEGAAAAPAAATYRRQGNEHPLMPALRWAEDGLARIKQIKDYSATLVKRERIGGEVGEHQYMFIKVRQKPFSVYMFFLGPPKLRGQEVIYVEGQNDGNMWAHPTGIKNTIVGTVSLSPTGMLAMQGQRYPITELGLQNLVTRLLEVGHHDAQYGECEVDFIEGAKINGRTCTCIQVMHPTPRRNFLFHLARIFVDDELNVPIRYEAYDWPKEPNGEPELLEEYTYLNLKLNCGFTDADFDIRNPNYQFRGK